MPTFQDKASRLLKQQKANKPKIGHGLPPSNDGFEGENRIQIVDGSPRLYYRTNNDWYFTGLVQDGAVPDVPIATATQLGVVKIGDGGTISSDGTYTATAATPAADNITGGDAAVTISTSSGAITIGPGGSNANVLIKGNDGGSTITALTFDMANAGAATFNDKIVATELDISGNVDIDGTLETDALTINGTTLAETIADTVGAMVSSNTESGITVAYQDADNTLDFTVGTLNQNTTGNAATATALETARNIGGVSFDGTANINLPGVNTGGNQDTTGNAATVTISTVSTNATHYLCFVDGTSGAQDIEVRSGVSVNPSTDVVTVGGIVIGDSGMTFGDNVDIGSYNWKAQTLESDVSTGTAPLTVASTTVVSNLNADYLDGQHGSYYLDYGNFVIDNDEIPIAKLAQDAVTVTAGTGLTGGGSVTLGSSITLNVAAGNFLDVQADAVDVDLSEASEAAIANGDYVLFLDGGSTGTLKKESLADLVELIEGTGLTRSGSTLSVQAGAYMAGDATGPSNEWTTTNADLKSSHSSSNAQLIVDCSSGSHDSYLIIEAASGRDSIIKLTEGDAEKWKIYNDGSDTDSFNIYDDGDSRLKITQAGLISLYNQVQIGSNSGSYPTAAHLIVGDTINSSSSASAQFDTFIRVEDHIIINNSSSTSDGVGWSYSSNAIRTYSEGNGTKNVYADADVVAYYSSDPRLKENKKQIDNPLNILSQINGYTFDWKESAKKIGEHLVGKDYGVMADEIEAVMPELVNDRDNGYKGVKYEKIVPLLIECIKEQQVQINKLRKDENGSS